MKPNQEQEDDGRLHAALREWVVDSSLRPGFQDQVWQRIAQAEVQSKPGFWAGWIRLIEVALPRPKVAISYLATLLILGVAAGSVTAQIKSSHVNADLSARYVQSVAPYRAETSQP